jgi:probable rRNA maturation factor
VAIRFHSEQIKFNIGEKSRHKNWISTCIDIHGKKPGAINFIFTSNVQILHINMEYLNHNYFTDVISFDYTEKERISGDIFISVDQVKANAEHFHTEFTDELRRVMIHGVLHLIGFRDDSKADKEVMRQKENEALNLWLKSQQNGSGI